MARLVGNFMRRWRVETIVPILFSDGLPNMALYALLRWTPPKIQLVWFLFATEWQLSVVRLPYPPLGLVLLRT